jgi:hypothetical protein
VLALQFKRTLAQARLRSDAAVATDSSGIVDLKVNGAASSALQAAASASAVREVSRAKLQLARILLDSLRCLSAFDFVTFVTFVTFANFCQRLSTLSTLSTL